MQGEWEYIHQRQLSIIGELEVIQLGGGRRQKESEEQVLSSCVEEEQHAENY